MSDFGAMSLLELFREELDAHAAALDAGLLALEASPDDRATLDALMRAAHSIKGAAKIVGLEAGIFDETLVNAALADVQAKLIELQKVCGDVVRTGQQFQSSLSKENFGLDPKNPDDAKKIKKAHAVLDAYLTRASKGTAEALTPMAKFENAVTSFSKECVM